jgi:hypothetical protein
MESNPFQFESIQIVFGMMVLMLIKKTRGTPGQEKEKENPTQKPILIQHSIFDD